MSLGAILIGTGLLILSVLFVANPLVRKKGKKKTIASKKLPTTSNQYEETLVALRDLDFDQRTGKITDEDYANLRAELLVKASRELQARNQQEKELDALIEGAIRGRQKEKLSVRTCKQCGSNQKTTDRFCSACGASLTPVCQNCGHEIKVGDLFCTGCGQSTKSVQQPQVETVG
jgi:double zinc ribbon protein